jgi:hypothetical protein
VMWINDGFANLELHVLDSLQKPLFYHS